MDCSFKYGNHGCNGGFVGNSYKFILEHGLMLESEYPYVAKVEHCSKPYGNFIISSFTKTEGCKELANALKDRPVSVIVDSFNWGFYSSGIFSNCGTDLSHEVLLVGMTD